MILPHENTIGLSDAELAEIFNEANKAKTLGSAMGIFVCTAIKIAITKQVLAWIAAQESLPTWQDVQPSETCVGILRSPFTGKTQEFKPKE